MQAPRHARLARDRLDATFAALADPTRRAILARLASGQASVTELAQPFAMSQPAISKHLKVLERAGLISRGREAQRRPRRIQAKRLAEATAWLEPDQRFWGGKYRPVWRHDTNGTPRGTGGVYREIRAPERLVHAEKFDEAWYPGEGVGTLVLVEHGGRTTLTHTMRYESREARDAVLKSGMEKGVTASYDRLAELLASTSAATT